MDRTHDAGSGDGGARLASWGWHTPLRVSRWADRAADDDAGQPHRDIHCTATDDAANGDVDDTTRANAQADEDAAAVLLRRGGTEAMDEVLAAVTDAAGPANGGGDGRAADVFDGHGDAGARIGQRAAVVSVGG